MRHLLQTEAVPAATPLSHDADAVNIMITAAGRRVELMELWAGTLSELKLSGGVMASDITSDTPAMRLSAESATVPPYADPDCLAALLALCEKNRIRLIVPTIDPELKFLAKHAPEFAALGCRINISSYETVDIGNDKRKTHTWLVKNGFPTVRQALASDVLSGTVPFDFPAIVKPARGSASQGVRLIESRERFLHYPVEPDTVIQSIAEGNEYTVDVFVDSNGRCRCAVPRRRIETRGGEVSKGVTARIAPVIDLARSVAETLPGAYGVMNVQIFYAKDPDRLAVIEINPRFGGGYPLSHRAGAHMTRWLLEEILGLPVTASEDWTEDVMMLRFDRAVYLSAADLV